jgi:hypothetical protein
MVIEDHTLLLEVGKAIRALDANIVIDIKGIPAQSKEGSYEWLSLDLLSSIEVATQTIQNSDKRLIFQLTCFSKHSEYRPDNDFTAPWKLASKFKGILHRAKYPIQNTCLKFLDTKMTYLDLRSSGDYAKELYQSSPLLQTHAVLITASALIS